MTIFDDGLISLIMRFHLLSCQSFPVVQPDDARYVNVSELAIMAENPDITACVFAPLASGGSGLKELLADDDSLAAFKSLTVGFCSSDHQSLIETDVCLRLFL